MFKSKVVMYGSESEDTALALRRLALLFDEVLLIEPTAAVFKDGPEEFHRRVNADSDGVGRVVELDWIRDVYSPLSFPLAQSKNVFLAETVTALEAGNVIKRAGSEIAPAGAIDDDFDRMRDLLLDADLGDPEFLQLCGTPLDWKSKPFQWWFVELARVGSDADCWNVAWLSPPVAWRVSESLSRIAFIAEKSHACPVLMEPQQIHALRRRFSRLAAAQPAANPMALGAESNSNSIGEALFCLAGQLFEDDVLRKLSPRDVVALRTKYTIARKALLDDCFAHITAMVETEEESELAKSVTVYVQEKLRPALHEFSANALAERDKLIGDLSVRTADVVRQSVVGTSAGGLVGSLLTGSSMWTMAIAGAAVAAANSLPAVASDLKEAWLERRKRQRSSLAYLAQLRSKSQS